MKHQVLISKGIRLAGLLCCFIALAIFVAPARTMAQDTATLSGTVTDKTGSSVPGASVVITSQGGNLTRSTETNADGAYVAAALPNGKYDLVITAQGFQRFQVTGIKLDVAQKARVDVSLTVGATTQEITVTGENVAQVDTQSAEVGSTITGKQVQQLELNGRNFTQLVQLSPGVINQTGQDEGVVGVGGSTSYSINGGRIEYNNWEIDGGDNMDNGSNNSLNVYPNIEAIAEFKVLTSNYGAQYGKNASGTVEVETKSGTDQFHGSAFYYGRNDAFNANNWERNGQGLGKPPYKKHDWGYTVGGPVFIPHLYNNEKKKTFVFWSQEWRRELVPGSLISQAVPSDAERTGDFTDVCPAYTGAAFDPAAFPSCPYQPGTAGKPFVNNQLPTPFSSTANAILNLIPKANNFGASGNYTSGPNTGSPLPTYLSNPSYNTHWREELIRIDHNLTENYRLTFRYIHDTWGTVNQGPLWGSYNNSFDNSNTSFVGPTTSFVARLTANFTPTLLNEFVASYTDDHIFLTTIGNVNLPSGGIDLLPFFPDSFNKTNKLPAFNIGGTTDGNVYGGGFGVDTGYFPWKNANPTYTYRDIVTKTWRNHTFFFGAYVVAAQKNQQATLYPQGSLTFDTNNPKTTGNPFADMLTAQISGYSQTSTQPYFYDRYKIFEPFFQDDWRVSKKLTVNLGLRWSIYGRYQEKFNQEYGFSIKDYNLANAPSYFAYNSDSSQFLDSTTGNVFNGIIQCEAKGVQTGCLQNKYMNPGPRIGFAYDVFGDGKWAVRGGYGIFFEHENGNEANAESLQFSASPQVLNAGVSSASGYDQVAATSAGNPNAVSPLSPYSIPDRVQWPYMQQWNLSVEHEFPAHLVTSFSYVGSKGTHLTRQYDLNQLTPVPAAENPFLATGSPITPDDCTTGTIGDPNNPGVFTYDGTGLPNGGILPNGTVLTQHAAQNLFVACGNPVAGYFRPYKGYGTITRIDNTANSVYNSLQISARRTFGDLTFSVSYTFSHSIDNSSDRYDSLFVDSNNPNTARASSNFDVRHAAVISYVYAFPFFKSPGIKHTLLGGWQASGITTMLTGLPFTVTNGTQISDNAGIANGASGILSFPNIVGDPYKIPASVQAAFNATGQFGKLYLNPLAFDLPVGLTFGNETRNSLRLPGRVQFDFGLFKRFAFKEHYAFEFRWENFNLFNHTQLNALGGSISAGASGVANGMGCQPSQSVDPTCGGNFLVFNGAHYPRIMQFGARFQF